MKSDSGTPATTKPWATNRFGDPRQLVHEAGMLEASDYRKWAKAREMIDAK